MIFRRKQGGCCGGRRGGFGAFGTPSYETQGRDCPPDPASQTTIDAWCDCMYPAGAERERCKQKYCAVFNPFNPGRCSADPRLVSPPWTEIGAGARNIRKPNAGFVNTVTNITRAPTLEEFEPDILYRTALTDPARFTFLAGLITSFPGVNVVLIVNAPLLILFGPVALQTLIPIAAAYAYQRGGNTRVMENVIGPTVDLAGDLVPTLINAIVGDYKVAALQFYCKRIARGLEKYKDEQTTAMRVIISLIGDRADQILALAKSMPAGAKIGGTWELIGRMLKDAAKAAPNNTGKIVNLAGVLLDTFSDSIAASISGNPKEALDTSTIKLAGGRLSLLSKLPPNVIADMVSEQNHAERLLAIRDGIDIAIDAYGMIEHEAHGIKFFGQLPDMIATAAAQMKGVLIQLRDQLDAWARTGQKPPEISAPPPNKSNNKGPPPPPSGANPAQRPSYAPIIGGLVGAKVAGLPGALVGAGVTLIFGKKKE